MLSYTLANRRNRGMYAYLSNLQQELEQRHKRQHMTYRVALSSQCANFSTLK
jgi:hypothetical protein